MQLMLALLLVMPSSLFQQAAAPGKTQGMTDPAAFAQFQAEKNPEAKKKLALNFEKNYPKSRRLPDVYIELSQSCQVLSVFSGGVGCAFNFSTLVTAFSAYCFAPT